jgi:hypothetical protein
MQLKSKAEVQSAINKACGVAGFEAAGDGAVAEKVLECCKGVAAMHADVSAIPIATIVALAMQLLPIIFGQGGFTVEKLQAVLQIIVSIFQ